MLKLFACHERSTTDLYRVISTYADAGNMERLEDAIDLLEEEGHDLELAGAALLGLDARRLCGSATKSYRVPYLFSVKPDTSDALRASHGSIPRKSVFWPQRVRCCRSMMEDALIYS